MQKNWLFVSLLFLTSCTTMNDSLQLGAALGAVGDAALGAGIGMGIGIGLITSSSSITP